MNRSKFYFLFSFFAATLIGGGLMFGIVFDAKAQTDRYGGNFVTAHYNSSVCKNANPYTGACSCPSGYTPELLDIFGNSSGCQYPNQCFDSNEYYCYANILRQNRFGGFFVTAQSYSSTCKNPNPFTGACSCGAGYTDKPADVWRDSSCAYPQACYDSIWHYCYSGTAPPDRFGGWYVKQCNPDDSGNCDPNASCKNPNPYTGSCSCPSGYSTQPIDVWWMPSLSFNSIHFACWSNVVPPPQCTLVISPPSASAQKGSTVQFNALYDPDGPGGPQGEQNISSGANWWSDNTTIATSQGNGRFLGVNASPPSASIHATYSGCAGKQADATLTVTNALNNPPVINSCDINPKSGNAPLPTNYTSSVTDPDGDPISIYRWNFGLGNTDLGPSGSFTYNSSGNYTVTLQAQDSRGAWSSQRVCGTVNVGSGNRLPEGVHDANDNNACEALGWTADPDDRNIDLKVKIYSDGTFVRDDIANRFRPDLQSAGVCPGGTCAFVTSLAGRLSSGTHSIEVRAVDAQTGQEQRLGGSPKNIFCTTVVNGACGSANGVPSASPPTSGLCSAGTPTSATDSGTSWTWTCSAGGTSVSCSAPKVVSIPPPTVTAKCEAGTPKADISWTNVFGKSDQGYWVDVSTDPNFGTFWNKRINDPNTTQTTAPDGFNGNPAFAGGAKYYVRIFYVQTGQHSPNAEFTARSDCRSVQTQCNPPLWDGWKVDSCYDESGTANCSRIQEAADWWCQNQCGKPKALNYNTNWTIGVGTKYIPTGRTCPNCSSHFSSVTCGTSTTGDIDTQAKFSDNTSYNGSLNFTLNGPSSGSGSSVPATLTGRNPGSYSATYNSGGPEATLARIESSCASSGSGNTSGSCPLSAGSRLTFTFVFNPITTCSSGQTQPYSTCQNNSCVSVNACGTSNCTSNAQCQFSGPPTVGLKANNQNGPSINVPYNTPITLSWSSTNANYCTASGDWSGSKNTTDTQSVGNLTQSKSYILTCNQSTTGQTATDSITVNVGEAPVADIKANGFDGPITIPYSTTANISWTSANVSSCSVSPTGWTGTSGNQSTGNLTSSQTYTLTCSGSGGTKSDSVTINISIPVLNVSCSVSPAEAKTGDTVTWTAFRSGGIGSYAYSWSGTDGLSGTTQTVTKVYTKEGTKTGTVTVTSGAQNKSAECLNSTGGEGVKITKRPPHFEEVIPE